MFLPIRTRLFASGLLLLTAWGCKEKSEVKPDPTPPVVVPVAPSQIATWVTNADKSSLFARQRVVLNFTAAANSNPVIAVDTTQRYQTMDGFGYTLTGGSTQVLSRMGATERAALLRELFATDSTWLGVSYLRVSIGASDLSERVYTYNDLPAGQTDVNMNEFSLAPEREHFIPVLKEILALSPNIKIMGSPWTAPSWMKTNNNPVGGSLRPEFYAAYARYFVKYLQGMAAEGIPIDAITLQNEPLYGGNNPSMLMSAAEQTEFIKNHVGPALAAAGLSTKIIAYDHNADRPDYPIAVLSDPAARPYVDGSAFHLYGGSISALSTVHDAFPTKNIYFTEQWTQAPGSFASDVRYHVDNLIIGAPRNWSRNVLEWNLANDASYGPHTTGGCTECLGAVTISGNTVTRNPSYYTVAHASKFVRPGSVRVATNVPGNLQNVAYVRPDGRKVLVVLNTGSSLQTFNIQFKGKMASTALYGGAVGTYIW
ncbi:glucosylceramidase [Hymenobacter sp. BT683]|uniref:Glucosylceramidase n=1 Tax=Hymenobacter jeongseonensis TaxID=2791027 RepID=A0ABS0ILS0_9BACT|nr:glycoside hydrolase family 30 beta sandwich domain-containing protein [Hymenobacter jeongseonensis]MBF9239293.1 glucosylceramidase [Hymenobacter jeongseonensis]